MTALAEKLQLAAREGAEKLQAGMPMSTCETSTSLPPLGSSEHHAAINEKWAAIKSSLERTQRTTQAMLDKLAHKAQKALTAFKKAFCKRVLGRAHRTHRPRSMARSTSALSSSSDGDGPAPHSHSQSHSLLAPLAHATFILEVCK